MKKFIVIGVSVIVVILVILQLLRPKFAESAFLKGKTLLDSSRYAEAIVNFDKAIWYKEKPIYFNCKGLANAGLGKDSIAIVDYNKAIEMNSTIAEYFLNRGVSYRKLKKYDNSLQDVNKAIELDDKYAKAYYNRGLLMASQMKFDEAVKDYNKSIELDGTNLEEHVVCPDCGYGTPALQ